MVLPARRAWWTILKSWYLVAGVLSRVVATSRVIVAEKEVPGLRLLVRLLSLVLEVSSMRCQVPVRIS